MSKCCSGCLAKCADMVELVGKRAPLPEEDIHIHIYMYVPEPYRMLRSYFGNKTEILPAKL